MLGFVTSSLVETTQRFVSYYQGVGQTLALKKVFNNSLVIHFILGVFISLILLACTSFLFEGFLNIPEDRIGISKIVYFLVVIILFTTFVTSPFRALLISHENIVYISIVDVLDGIFKVIAVVVMANSSYDKLLFYGFIMLSIQLLNFLALSIYCYLKYEECVKPSIRSLEKNYVKELFSFAGWKIFGTLSVVGRQQGMSIVFNKFIGTTVNAGLGIGNQLSGYTNFLSSAIVNAMAPQIVKAEGGGGRDRAIWLSNILTKLNFFLMSILGIPMIFEAQNILKLWLGDIPEYSVIFCITFIIGLLFDSLTIGLTHINNAVGKINKYMLCMGIPKLLTVVLVYITILMEYPLIYSCIIYIVIEALTSFNRIILIHEQINLNVFEYIKNVIIRSLFPALMCVASCYMCSVFINWTYSFIVTFLFSSITYSLCMYFCGLSTSERNIVNRLIAEIKDKIV